MTETQTDPAEGLADLVGAEVVVDTSTQMVYIGVLTKIAGGLMYMDDVDVHDNNQTSTSKELYVIEARKHGVKVNRRATRVVFSTVVSVSRLEDVIAY